MRFCPDMKRTPPFLNSSGGHSEQERLNEGGSKLVDTFADGITFSGRSRIVSGVPVNDTRTFSNVGHFELQRVSTVPKLTTQ